jgi:hypothetical protein
VIESCRPTSVVLAPQAAHGVGVAPNHMQQVLWNKVAPDIQPLDRGGKVQRRPPQALPQGARSTKAVGCGGFLKRGVEVLSNEPGGRGSAASSDPVRFEENDLYAGGRKRPGARAAGQAPTDHDYIGFDVAAKGRMGTTATFREAIQPDGHVTRHAGWVFYPARSAFASNVVSGFPPSGFRLRQGFGGPL